MNNVFKIILRIINKLDFIIIAILIGLIYFGFKPLFETVAGSSQVTIEALSGAMGAIIGAGFTWVLLNRQSAVESQNKKEERYFQEKLKIFSETIQNIETSIKNNFHENTKEEDVEKLVVKIINFKSEIKSYQPKLSLIAGPQIQTEFENILSSIDESLNEVETELMDKNEFVNSIQITINKFARVCNSDINMGDELIEKLKEEEVSENKEDVKIKKTKPSQEFRYKLDLSDGTINVYRNTKFNYGNKEKLSKGRTCFFIIKDIYEKEKSKIKDMESLRRIIPIEWYNFGKSTNKKVFLTIEDSELATKTQSEMRSFINKNDIFNLGHVKAVVTDQWGDNVEHFINEIKKNHPDLWKKIKVHSG